MDSVLIEVFSDIACPWCFIGERRLSRAIQEVPDVAISWKWKPYQLQPELPREGLEWKAFMEAKFGGAAGAAMAFRNVAMAAAHDGIEFNFDRAARAPNTSLAHQAVLYAETSGHDLARQMAEALFTAHFTEGWDVTSLSTILAIGEDLGIDVREMGEQLQSGELSQQVSASQDEALQLGITGVPFYIFDRTYAISGAQPVELFARALQQVAAGAQKTG